GRRHPRVRRGSGLTGAGGALLLGQRLLDAGELGPARRELRLARRRALDGFLRAAFGELEAAVVAQQARGGAQGGEHRAAVRLRVLPVRLDDVLPDGLRGGLVADAVLQAREVVARRERAARGRALALLEDGHGFFQQRPRAVGLAALAVEGAQVV